MDALNPLIVPLMGANINRRTVDNIRTSSLQINRVTDMALGGIFKLISACPASVTWPFCQCDCAYASVVGA